MDDKKGESEPWPSHDIPGHEWAELTQVCLINILSRLSFEDRWRGAMLVCKPWLQACQDPSLNSVIDLETQFPTTSESPRYWTPEFERAIHSMIRCMVIWGDGCVTTVRVRHCTDHSLALLAERTPNLQVLSIKFCPHVTDETISKIASGCPLLRELDISFCPEISHKSLALIGQHCVNLQILRQNFMNWLDSLLYLRNVPREYLDACPHGDSEAAAIGKFMPQIVHLEIQSSKFTNKGLTLISEGCMDLEHLDLSGCANVTSQGVSNATLNLKQLKTLKKPYGSLSVSNSSRYGHWQLYDERFERGISEFDQAKNDE